MVAADQPRKSRNAGINDIGSCPIIDLVSRDNSNNGDVLLKDRRVCLISHRQWHIICAQRRGRTLHTNAGDRHRFVLSSVLVTEIREGIEDQVELLTLHLVLDHKAGNLDRRIAVINLVRHRRREGQRTRRDRDVVRTAQKLVIECQSGICANAINQIERPERAKRLRLWLLARQRHVRIGDTSCPCQAQAFLADKLAQREDASLNGCTAVINARTGQVHRIGVDRARSVAGIGDSVVATIIAVVDGHTRSRDNLIIQHGTRGNAALAAYVCIGEGIAAATQAVWRIAVADIAEQAARDRDRCANRRGRSVIGLDDVARADRNSRAVDRACRVAGIGDRIVRAIIAIIDADTRNSDRAVTTARIGVGKGIAAAAQRIAAEHLRVAARQNNRRCRCRGTCNAQRTIISLHDIASGNRHGCLSDRCCPRTSQRIIARQAACGAITEFQ